MTQRSQNIHRAQDYRGLALFPSSINYLAVGVSAIAAFALSFIWFTVIFREPYLAGLGKTAEELARGPSVLVASILQLAGNVVMAYALAWLLSRMNIQSVAGGIATAFLVWLGFIVAFLGPTYAYQAFSLEFFAIMAGYPLVALLLMGAILGAWRVRSSAGG